MIEQIIKDQFSNNKCRIQESEIKINNDVSYWQSVVLDSHNFPISGGFNRDRVHARKISISEYLERTKVRELSSEINVAHNKWGFNLIPTACGFAAGFHRDSTLLRSLQEATERWVMSQWIDHKYYIPLVTLSEIKPQLGVASLYFINQFDEVLFFKKEVSVKLNGRPIKIEVVQTMGIKDNGIYPGSSTRSLGESIWEHALVESFRTLLGSKNNPVRLKKFPDNRVHFFSQNKDVALLQIRNAVKYNWPIPKIKFLYAEQIYNDNVTLARTIIDGWRSWNEGPIDRFLY